MSKSKMYEEQKKAKADRAATTASARPDESEAASQTVQSAPVEKPKKEKKSNPRREVMYVGEDALGRKAKYNVEGKRIIGWPTIIATIICITCAIALIIWFIFG